MNKLLKRFTNSSDARGKRIVLHILYATGLKGINAGVSFLVIPLYLSYLTDISYGIWITISSVLNWFNFFDLGMGHGLRNKFAEAKAKGENELARKYVSTTYALLGLVAAGVMLIFLVVHLFVDWSLVFAAPPEIGPEVNRTVWILFALFCPQFVAQLIKMIVTADQRPAVANLINSTVNILQLLGLFLFTQFIPPSLDRLALLMGGISLGVPLLANFILFSTRYKAYRPTIPTVDFKLSKDLMGLGFTFFVMQGAALVVFMTDSLIITQVLGPDQVPAYNTSFRYFNLATVFFGLVTTPFWSAFTDAYVKKDFGWIRKMLSRLIRVWYGFAAVCVLLYFLAPTIYGWWIKGELVIARELDLVMMLMVLTTAFVTIYGTFLSGVGKLRLSLSHAVVVMVINIPLSIYLAKIPSLGSAGVMLASLLGTALRLFFQPVQTYKILKGTAKGWWNA